MYITDPNIEIHALTNLSLHLRVPRFPMNIFSSISRIWSRRVRSTMVETLAASGDSLESSSFFRATVDSLSFMPLF